MATARALHLLPPVEDELVPVPRLALERLIDNCESIADDLDAAIEATWASVWSGSRPAVLDNLSRMGRRVERLREDFEPIGGKPTEPRPLRLA